MSLEICRKALEKRLATLTPAIAIAYENVVFTPITGTPYHKASLLPNETTAPAIDQATKIEKGIFQVSIYYPLNQGTATAGARAELIRAHFPAGLVLTESTYKVRISRPPTISGGMVEGAFYMIPVSIYFISIK
jgi:Bacteriophage related domain of unknown function